MRPALFETRQLATWYKEARHCRIEMIFSGLQLFILTCNCHFADTDCCYGAYLQRNLGAGVVTHGPFCLIC